MNVQIFTHRKRETKRVSDNELETTSGRKENEAEKFEVKQRGGT